MSSPSPIPISSQQSSDNHQSQSSTTIRIPSILTRLSGLSRHALSNSRPWTELIDRSAFSRPGSLSEAASRVRKNAAYFRVNYLIVLAIVVAYSLISHPLSLLTLVTLSGAWIFLYVLRPSDQPLVIFGRMDLPLRPSTVRSAFSDIRAHVLRHPGPVRVGPGDADSDLGYERIVTDFDGGDDGGCDRVRSRCV